MIALKPKAILSLETCRPLRRLLDSSLLVIDSFDEEFVDVSGIFFLTVWQIRFQIPEEFILLELSEDVVRHVDAQLLAAALGSGLLELVGLAEGQVIDG